MNVLKPNYVTVKDRCYRSFDGQQDSKGRNTVARVEAEAGTSKKVLSGYEASRKPASNNRNRKPEAEDSWTAVERENAKKVTKDDSKQLAVNNEPEEENSDVEIIALKEGFLLLVDVPKCFRGLVYGTKRQMLNKIISATNTRIQFPYEHSEEPIKIFGNSRVDLLSARKRITQIVDNARERTDFSHFIAVYAKDSRIQDNFKKFRSEVLEKCAGSKGVAKELFTNENRLHLTFGILVLLGEKERKKAESLLFDVIQEFVKQAEKQEPMKIRFKGLEYMNDDPSEVHVLYAKVEQLEGGIDLQLLANKIVKELAKSKLMIKVHREDVKLHLTLMNSRYRNNESIRENYYAIKNNREIREPFDARQILAEFSDFEFGEMVVNEIEILRNGAFDERGFYKSTAKVPVRKATRTVKGPSIRMVLNDDDP